MLLQLPLRYKAWADRRTLDAVAGIARETHAASLAFACQQLNHMVRVEELFRARLTASAEPHDTTNSAIVPALDELDERLMRSNRWLQDYAAALSPAQAQDRIRFRFVDGNQGTLTREEAIFHLINHGTYHRGAIGHALDLAGAARPADTYTVFVHAAEPSRREGQTPVRAPLVATPPVDGVLSTSWQRWWTGLAAGPANLAWRDALIARYSEPWRRYHTLQHLSECIAAFEASAQLALRPAEVEAALWFHDAVYELQRADNEERSASLARQVLSEAGVAEAATSRIERLVLATRHTALPSEPDEQLLVDIDLAILGAPEPRFREYERQIRDEYASVPEGLFRARRRAILRSIAERPRIYGTGHFHGRLEQQARNNLARAIGENGAAPAGGPVSAP